MGIFSIRTPCAAALALAAALAAAAPGAAAKRPEGDSWFRQGRMAVAEARARLGKMRRAKNAVIFLGDGMGVSTVTAARIFSGQLRGAPGEEGWLSFERLPHLALIKTYTTDHQVPDSAGTMTAILSGLKTKSGVLGVASNVVFGSARSVRKSRVPTLCEQAEQRGLATGIVTTARLTHATPAACYAHAPNRNWENDTLLPAGAGNFPDIARQLAEFSHGDGLELAMGGGRSHFMPAEQADPEHPELRGARADGRDLVAEWRARNPGGAYLWKRAQLEALNLSAAPRVLGLFAPSHMAFESERTADAGGEPSLAEMTQAALRILGGSEGFLLIVEGGRIDHAHHRNNARRALEETLAFSQAVSAALRLTDPEETLVVVTADHSHPLTLAGYALRGNPILGKLAERAPGDASAAPARDGAGRSFTTLLYAIGPGHHAPSEEQPAGAKRYPHAASRWRAEDCCTADALAEVDTTAPDHLQQSGVPRANGAHSGEDVAAYARGPGAALFSGVREQHYIYHAIVEALGWNDAAGGAPEESR